MRITALLFVALLSMPTVAFAQHARPHVSALLIPQPQAPETSVPREVTQMGSRDDYWLEGAIGGGVLLGAATARFAYELCKDPDSNTSDRNCSVTALLSALPGATAGGVIGAFIGKAIPKR